ncbi:helix-turn-helix domain-containing protein [Microbacterium sp. M1A1_1b]
MAIETNATVAGEVRGVAAKRQMTSAALADRLGLSRMAMSRRMSGDTPFTAAEIVGIADALHVPVETLYGRPSGFVADDELAQVSA